MSSSHLPATTNSLDQAAEAETPSEAISILYMILDNPSSSSEAIKIKEQAITNLSDLLIQEGRAIELRQLPTKLRPFFSLIPKAKTGKIVRSIVDSLAMLSGTSEIQISLCKEIVQWTHKEKRTFLRHRIEARLAALLMGNHEFSKALNLLVGLVKEVKRIGDKLLLVEIQLLQSKLHFYQRDLPKSKAALKSAKKSANAVHVPPAQQGSIDLQSGILLAQEMDYTTAYSYFFEAFEAFEAIDDPQAIRSLEYMLLCKIMVYQPAGVPVLIHWATVVKRYQGLEFHLIEEVADACSQRSIKLFDIALQKYKNQLEEDPIIIHWHLSSMYDTLLEQNLYRLIEPFSRVEIAHIAELIELPAQQVGKKLSQMILDKKLVGRIDLGADCLIIFDDPKTDTIYSVILDAFSMVGKIVDRLYATSAKMMS